MKKLKKEVEELFKASLPSNSKKVFAISTASLFREVFGVNSSGWPSKNHLIAYILLSGVPLSEVSEKSKESYGYWRQIASRMYRILDTENQKEMVLRVLGWMLKTNNIVVIPTKDQIKEPVSTNFAKHIIKYKIKED